MTRIYIFGDETGDTAYSYTTSTKGGGASKYFGVGTATYTEQELPQALTDGMRLRVQLSASNPTLITNGFHACDDSNTTRTQVFGLIKDNPPRFDATFLAKHNAYNSVKDKGGLYLYKYAWYLHLQYVINQCSNKSDHVVLVLAEYGTKNLHNTVLNAVQDICAQVDRKITPCIWRSPTCLGLQIADYGMWAIQRKLNKGECHWYNDAIAPHLETQFFPWGK